MAINATAARTSHAFITHLLPAPRWPQVIELGTARRAHMGHHIIDQRAPLDVGKSFSSKHGLSHEIASGGMNAVQRATSTRTPSHGSSLNSAVTLRSRNGHQNDRASRRPTEGRT